MRIAATAEAFALFARWAARLALAGSSSTSSGVEVSSFFGTSRLLEAASLLVSVGFAGRAFSLAALFTGAGAGFFGGDGASSGSVIAPSSSVLMSAT